MGWGGIGWDEVMPRQSAKRSREDLLRSMHWGTREDLHPFRGSGAMGVWNVPPAVGGTRPGVRMGKAYTP
jgi:hypothetical protein